MKKCLILSLIVFISTTSYNQHISSFQSIVPTSKDATFQFPVSHTFQYIIEHGDGLTSGGSMPDQFDFTGYIPIANSSTNGYLGINSELVNGGVTILDINFDPIPKSWQITASQAVDFTDVNGIYRPCSGTVTDWGTLMSCEEYNALGDGNMDGYNDAGWCVEIDPVTRKVINHLGGLPIADKLWALGNYKHENIVIHANRRTAYLGADSNPGYLYKFVANVAEDFSSGSLYVYKELTPTTGEWVLLDNTTPAEQNSTLSQSANEGAKVFNAIEDVEISPIDGQVYLAVKNENRVYRLQDSDPIIGTSVAGFETYVGGTSYLIDHAGGSTLANWGTGNDNLAFDDLGNLWVLQDGSNEYIWLVEEGHTQAIPKVKLFGISPLGSEPTGITFTPDYKYLMMSFQHPNATNIATLQKDAFDIDRAFDKDVAIVIAVKGNLGSTALPVELISFNARAQNGSAFLHWTTASEINFSHFEIQKSQSGENWMTIGQQLSTNGTNEIRTYSFEDIELFSGNNYYRLKIVDRDGTFEYSDTQVIHFAPEALVQIFPNPTKGKLNIQINFNIEEMKQITLFNGQGQIVFNQETTAANIYLPTFNLPTGYYYLKLNTPSYQTTEKVLITH